jgi:hypothetical protein
MPRTCLACNSQRREEINRELMSGAPTRSLAKKFNINHHALRRHMRNHLAKELALAIPVAQAALSPEVQEAAQRRVSHSADLLRQMDSLVDEAHNIKAQAVATGKLSVALRGIDQICRLFELAAKLRGELGSTTNVQINTGSNALPVLPCDAQGKPILPPGVGPYVIAYLDTIFSVEDDNDGGATEMRFREETAHFTPLDFEELWRWCKDRCRAAGVRRRGP